ncbi:MAG: 2-dehydropantoate 2-reductase [Lentisphaerae bacterium]|nr:2-dehydropantoate 2-reductase [Lentisphaerota bacterium]
MKILNVSCGAVGAYFCGRLAEQGAEVAVTVRSDRELIAQKGFEIQSIAGDFIFRPTQVLSSAAEYHEHADYIILTSKVLPDADAVELLRPAVQAGTVIVLIQNGLGIEDAIAEAFPENEILSAVAYIGVTRVAPGKLAHQGAGRLTIGKFGGGKSEAGTRLCQLFNQANVQADYTEDIAFYRWKKLLWNVPFNCLSVLGGGLLTNEMTDSGELEELCRKLMREVIATAWKCGVKLPDSMVEENIEYTRNFPSYKTSMLIDCENSRPLEVEAIAGSVVALARKHQIPIPCLETVYALLKAFDLHKQTVKKSLRK